MGQVGVVIVLLIIVLLLGFMVLDMNRKLKEQYKYEINFLKELKAFRAPLVKLKIGGLSAYFLLDTGSTINIVRTKYLDKVGAAIVEDDNSSVMTASGEMAQSQGFHEEVFHNKKSFGYNEFSVADLDLFDDPEINKGYEIAGLLGSKFFQEHRWTVDFDKMVVWVK